jgi:GT2 family glycosyltransferase
MNDVLIIIVTYNRLNLLKRCLNNCNYQSFKSRDIIVIDNNSTDGTFDFLENNGINNIKLNENLGSAMGWNQGLKYALNKNYKYVWLMDDDGYPERTSLQNLLNNFDYQYSCISSLVVCEDDKNKLVFSMPIINRKKFKLNLHKFKKVNLVKQYSKNNLYEFAHLFNGSLIRLNTVKKIGNINNKYFMYGDELDYYFRLSKVGRVVTCVNSLHLHPNVENRKCSKFWIYYYLKNSIIINKKYRNLYFIRSSLIIFLCLYRVLLRNGFRDFFKILFFNKYKFYNAIFNGFIEKIGNELK